MDESNALPHRAPLTVSRAVFAETHLRQSAGRFKSPEIIGKEMAVTPIQGGKKANITASS
jgi:hypothetical protein